MIAFGSPDEVSDSDSLRKEYKVWRYVAADCVVASTAVSLDYFNVRPGLVDPTCHLRRAAVILRVRASNVGFAVASALSDSEGT